MANVTKDEILTRLNDFREYCGMSKATFAASIGMEQTTVNNQFLGKRSLSLDLVLSTLNAFSELSGEWLLRDRGDMLISKYSDTPEAMQLKYSERIEKLISTIETLQETIDLRNRLIESLQSEVEQLKKQVN